MQGHPNIGVCRPPHRTGWGDHRGLESRRCIHRRCIDHCVYKHPSRHTRHRPPLARACTNQWRVDIDSSHTKNPRDRKQAPNPRSPRTPPRCFQRERNPADRCTSPDPGRTDSHCRSHTNNDFRRTSNSLRHTDPQRCMDFRRHMAFHPLGGQSHNRPCLNHIEHVRKDLRGSGHNERYRSAVCIPRKNTSCPQNRVCPEPGSPCLACRRMHCCSCRRLPHRKRSHTCRKGCKDCHRCTNPHPLQVRRHIPQSLRNSPAKSCTSDLRMLALRRPDIPRHHRMWTKMYTGCGPGTVVPWAMDLVRTPPADHPLDRTEPLRKFPNQRTLRCSLHR